MRTGHVINMCMFAASTAKAAQTAKALGATQEAAMVHALQPAGKVQAHTVGSMQGPDQVLKLPAWQPHGMHFW